MFWRKAATKRDRHLRKMNVVENGGGRMEECEVQEDNFEESCDHKWNACSKERSREIGFGISAGGGCNLMNSGSVFAIGAGSGSVESGVNQGGAGADRERRVLEKSTHNPGMFM